MHPIKRDESNNNSNRRIILPARSCRKSPHVRRCHALFIRNTGGSVVGQKEMGHRSWIYRLKNTEAFVEMGFLDYFDKEGICLIEWSERISSLLPKNTLHVELIHLGDERRRIDVHES